MAKAVQDHGYAWVILGVTLVYNTIEATVFMSPSVLLIAWDEHFTASKAQLGAVGSLMSSMACVSSKQTHFSSCLHSDL